LAASWTLPAFLNPSRDGAVLPFLHLNGAKISGPTVFGRRTDSDLTSFLSGLGWEAIIVTGDVPELVLRDLHAAIADAHRRIRLIQRVTRSGSPNPGLRWPAIVLRTPKGWTGPHRVDGKLIEGTHWAHQVPLSVVRENPRHRAQLERWLLSYRPEEIFAEDGSIAPQIRELAPSGDKRLGATPHANGGRVLQPLTVRPLETYALEITSPGHTSHETTRVLGEMMRDLYADNKTTDGGGNFRLFSPDETSSNRLSAVFDETARCWQLPATADDDDLTPDGRVMEVLSEHLCQGWLEGYLLSGRHGLFATYEAFAMVSVSMLIQHVKWLQHARDLPWRADVASMNVLLTSTCWRNDHNGFSHQGPGLVDAVLPLAPGVVQVWFPPDSNTLLAVAEQMFAEFNRVNVIVVDKQSHPQFLDLPTARVQVAAGMSIWPWAGTEVDHPIVEPDIVLACAGDVPTEETLAAAALLRMWVPDLLVRVVNVIDLMTLVPPDTHPHGASDAVFERLFTASTDVVFAFHGYPRAVHQLLHGRSDPGRFHVRGFNEQGTTTTAFDMVVLNGMSRFHLVMEALRRTRTDVACRAELIEHCEQQLAAHSAYIREHFEDMPEIRDWRWS
ncbi:phosphoketolase family protein, partial [Williamsia sp.]|uniref:phosphoketolase family protein n=1 Tax=Williamsia sp. TaxID=1872085 RepID=UPI001A222D5E